MPYISLTNKKNSKESLTTIFCTVITHLYTSFNENYGCHDDTVTDIHRQSQMRNGVHGNIMAPDHPKMILGVHRDRMHESKVSLDGFTIRNSRSFHPSLE